MAKKDFLETWTPKSMQVTDPFGGSLQFENSEDIEKREDMEMNQMVAQELKPDGANVQLLEAIIIFQSCCEGLWQARANCMSFGFGLHALAMTFDEKRNA